MTTGIRRSIEFFALFKKWRKMKSDKDDCMKREEDLSAQMRVNLIGVHYGFLFNQYRDEYRLWYAPFVFFRRALFVFIYLQSLKDPEGLKPSLAIFILCIFSLICELTFRPYLKTIDRVYSAFCMIVLSIVSYIISILNTLYFESLVDTDIDRIESNQAVYITVALILILVWLMGSLYLLVHNIMYAKYDPYQQWVDRMSKVLIRGREQGSRKKNNKKSVSLASIPHEQGNESDEESNDDTSHSDDATTTFFPMKEHRNIHKRISSRTCMVDHTIDNTTDHETTVPRDSNVDVEEDMHNIKIANSMVVEQVADVIEREAKAEEEAKRKAEEEKDTVGSLIKNATTIEYVTVNPSHLSCL